VKAARNEALQHRPVYAVLFASEDDVDAPYSPIVDVGQENEWPSTFPHGLDREVAAALPGLWYCLHLPATFFELVNLNAASIKSSQDLYLGHRIVLAPLQAFDRSHIPEWLALDTPALVICPDVLYEEARTRSAALGFAIPPVRYSELTSDSLGNHWALLHSTFGPKLEYIGRPPTLPDRLDIQPVHLPTRLLARQFDASLNVDAATDGDLPSLVDEALTLQLLTAAIARLEVAKTAPADAERLLPETMENEQRRLRLPVTVAVPGVPSAYVRRRYGSNRTVDPIDVLDEDDRWALSIEERADSAIERATIEFAAAHSAVAQHGVGIMLPQIPAGAFVLLAELERHFQGHVKAGSVWRLLKRLNEAAASVLSEEAVQLIARASRVTAFSNFPVGLLSLPGDSAPLLCRVPITYRPLLPLTRTIQFELADSPVVDFTNGFRVLVAECIPPADPVGRLSRAGWTEAHRIVAQSDHASEMTFEREDVDSVDTLNWLIAERQPQLLVLSAHGALDRTGNTAGIVIGETLCLGPEFERMAPVVILSACHVAPRGGAAVAITDLLLRQGAIAVLGTQVPVDVRRNAMLTVRFLLYVMEVRAGREPHDTLLDVWHRVQTSNAINDILDGSASLHEWGLSKAPSGLPILTEFMMVRSPGAIRLGEVYRDTERVLATIADEQGEGARIRALFRSPGYVPESIFYLFAGRPDRVLLRPPAQMPRDAWDEMRRR
jgi:hypothetical protein